MTKRNNKPRQAAANEASPDETQRAIIAGCRAIVAVLARRGIGADDVANGLIAYGGAMALTICGPKVTANVFQSKADALRKAVVN